MIRVSKQLAGRLQYGDDTAERISFAVDDNFGESVLQTDCFHFSFDGFAGVVYVNLDGSAEQRGRLGCKCVRYLQINEPRI